MKLEKTIIIILILLSFFVIISTTLDPDLGWHIKSGEWIINHQQIQHHDEFSYTMAGHQWVNHEWLVDTILYLSYHHQLWIVMTILFTIISSLPFIYYTLQSKNYPELSYILLSSIILIPYLAVRPQIISFFLFFVLYLLLQKIFQSKSSPIFTLATILLFLSWANIHAGFPAGLILFAIFIISKISQSYQTHKKIIWPAKQLAIFASSILVTFINPYTYHLYSEIYHVAASEITAKYIAEWQPILSTVRPENLIYLGLTISFTIIFFKKIK
ncbi:hypothetical protein KJ855_02395, partial [Patescibacteria group bacterium]|nr:hypothetical protein [Patescibacteria group bacterium]